MIEKKFQVDLLRKSMAPGVLPFKVIQGHRNQHGSIGHLYDLLLVLVSNHGTISHRSRDRPQFRSKIAKFPHPCLFNAAKRVPIGIL